MTEKNEVILKENMQESIQEDLKLELAVLEMFKQVIPSRIFLFLLAYGELSLKQLSEALGKSKATILRHTKPMVTNQLILVIDKKDSRSKFFRLNPRRINLNTPEIVLPYIKKMTPRERQEMYNSLVAVEKSLLLLMKYTIDMSLRYMDLYTETKKNVEIDEKMIADMFEEMEMKTSWDMFNKDTRKMFDKHWKIFWKNFKKDLDEYYKSKEVKDGQLEEMDYDYMRWEIIVPLKRVLKWSSPAFEG
ncbi:MAG: ArsR/SmtB family transcription factor [Candidatus Odinarchaeota archaeon]